MGSLSALAQSCFTMAEGQSSKSKTKGPYTFNFFKRELRQIKSFKEREEDVLKEQMEAFDFYEQLHKDGGVYTVQVKCGTKKDEVIAELSNSDCLWKIQRKMKNIQSIFEKDGLTLRLTCGCTVVPCRDMDCFPFTLPKGFKLKKRPFSDFCDAQDCVNRAVVSKGMNIVVTCERAQLTTIFWNSMEKKIKTRMQLKAPNVAANMCIAHFKDNYKIDCPKCAHMFVDEFRQEVKKRIDTPVDSL